MVVTDVNRTAVRAMANAAIRLRILLAAKLRRVRVFIISSMVLPPECTSSRLFLIKSITPQCYTQGTEKVHFCNFSHPHRRTQFLNRPDDASVLKTHDTIRKLGKLLIMRYHNQSLAESLSRHLQKSRYILAGPGVEASCGFVG